jgi:hypothetical protein
MKSIKWLLAIAVTVLMFNVSSVLAQKTNTKSAATPAAKSATENSQETNIRAYIELLRSDVKTKKTAVLVELMQLTDEQAEKFWPIYREYDFDLQTLNEQKIAGIQEYAKSYQNMTDEKADELAKLALELENKRTSLKARYYEEFRAQLGGIIAARFLQVENQMLMVIDLQIASSLPIVEK